MGGERIGWEYHNISLTRVKGYGFGIAVSGGRDNPHFIDGEYESSITISDVLKDGPAEGKLYVNDIVMNVNGVSLENVDYNSAVQVLRECGNCVNLLIKRKVSLQTNNDLLKVTLTKSKRKDDFGIVLGCRLFIKEITNRSLIEKDRESSIQEGDLVVKINNTSTENLSLKEAKKLIESSKEKLNLVIRRELNGNNAQNQSSQSQRWSSSNLYDNASAIKDSQSYDNSVNNNNSNSNSNNSNINNRSNWSNQNVYVQPPTRGDYARHASHATHTTHNTHNTDDKNNLNKIARNRGPIMDISLHQLDQPATPLLTSSGQHSRGPSLEAQECVGTSATSTSATAIASVPPRPPPPRPSCAIPEEPSLPLSLSLRSKSQISAINEVQTQSQSLLQSQSSQTRFISFQKDNNNSNIGIRLTGGNVYGIFVTAVQPSSAACLQGLQAGDKILKANNTDMRGVTREEAVLFLLSIQQQIDLVVQYRKEEYDEIIAAQKGDSFYIRVHFAYESTVKGELSFHVAEVFHVIDTLYNGSVGSWLVYRLGRNNQEIQKGAIPNQTRAEELAAAKAAKNKDEKVNESSSRGSFWSKRRSARKSKLKYQWEDVVGSGDNLSKFSAYERVTLKHAGFIRPVVLFGPLADVARDKLLKDYPDKYAFPQLDSIGNSASNTSNKCSIVRLSAIKEIIDKAKHALLDITPSAVDRLNYAQFYPIVIFMRAENKSVVKELRSRLPKSMHKSSRKLYDNGVKIEKLWSHVFTATITLTNAGQEMWYKKLRETLEKQQQQSIWVAESKPEEAIGDDFLFPLTSRLSYASSPESDLDLTNDSRLDADMDNDKELMGRLGLGLVKASSDPSIATAEDTNIMIGDKPAMNTFGYPPPYSVHTNVANIANCSNPPIRPTNPPPNTKQLPLHILLRKELSKALTNEAKTKTLNTTTTSIDETDREEYFGSVNNTDAYNNSNNNNNNNTLPPEERYPLSPVSPTCDIYGTKHSRSHSHSSPQPLSQPQPPHSTAPEPPPRIDRNSKPSRFRSAHERLFGRRVDRDVNIFNTPDYINTTQKCDSLDRQQQLTNGRSNSLSGPAFGDSSSYSSDSYNKYGSPSSTLDNKHHNNYNHHNRYNSVASTNSTHNSNNGNNGNHSSQQSRATHDPYRFTRSTAQPHPPHHANHANHSLQHSKQSNTGSPSKYVTDSATDNSNSNNNSRHMQQQINVTPQSQTHSRPPPPSPPPKPNNYQLSTIQSDGRPVPPPKPSHYQLSRPQLSSQQTWYSDSANEAIDSNPSFGHNYSSVYNTTNSKRASNGGIGGNVSNGGLTNGGIELSNGPPAYYPHKQHTQHTQHTDQPPNVRAPQIPNYGADHAISSYSDQHSSHIRKGAPYSDTDSSSGYIASHTKTGTSYVQDMHMRSPYSNHNCGPYLNVPYPPKHHQHYRYDSINNSTPTQHSIQLSPQPPSNLIDLSINREQRGSAFELFRK